MTAGIGSHQKTRVIGEPKEDARDRFFTAAAKTIRQAGTDRIIPCRINPEAWFPFGEGNTYGRQRLAHQLCAPCPIRAECATWATTPPVETDGIWGGLWMGGRHTRRTP